MPNITIFVRISKRILTHNKLQTNIKMIQLSDIIEYIKEYVINVSHDVEDLVVKNISTLDSSLPECMGWIATYKKRNKS